MKKTITVVLTFMFLQTSMFGWHESFSVDATPSLDGSVVSDMTWTWWGWGGVEVTGGDLVMTIPDPGTDPFDIDSNWLQIDQTTDPNGVITPTNAEIWIKMKFEREGGSVMGDQFHTCVAIDPDFLTNFGVYTAAIHQQAGVGGYFFATDEFSGPVSSEAVGYNTWFWEKITVVDDTVSVWAFADGDTPSADPQHVFTTDNVASPAATLIIVGAFDDDSTSLHISDIYYNESPDLGIDDDAILANGFDLSQNYPNPFNPVTNISYTVPVTGQVKLSVFNVLGEEVSTLINNVVTSGTHSATWNAGDMPSGVYFYSIEATGFTQTKKLLLIK
ncbi:MAG: T9SS type A sorting domain-containing protein [Candidatus Marinimicrobia bacterium]|nr:T9SS type A sorting domain-containing protein [Candidatus Neomarinimicrobiota bacterium]